MKSTDKANTPDEVVDVVDENDEIVSSATKREVNSNPKLIHREIAVLIYDKNDRVYIQQRSLNKKVMPSVWTISVAGHIPTGMTPEKAAHLELDEELGFDTKLNFSYKERLNFPNETHFAYLYLGKFPEGGKVKINKDEIAQGKFVNLKEIKEMQIDGEVFEEYSLEDIYRFWEGKLPD